MKNIKCLLFLFFLFAVSNLSAQDSSRYNIFVGMSNLNFEFGIESHIVGTDVKFALEGPFAWGLESNVFAYLLNSTSVHHKFGISVGVNYYYSEFESGLFKFIMREPNTKNKKRISFYIGPIYEITWKDFFFSTSIGIGNNNYKYPRLSYSIGYQF